MARLIDADRLAAFPHKPTSGTEDIITEWIEEIFSIEEIIDHKEDLEKLCWKVINGFIGVIETEPTVDAVEVVMCKDCQSKEKIPYYPDEQFLHCTLHGVVMDSNAYCSHGEKMDGGDE